MRSDVGAPGGGGDGLLLLLDHVTLDGGPNRVLIVAAEGRARHQQGIRRGGRSRGERSRHAGARGHRRVVRIIGGRRRQALAAQAGLQREIWRPVVLATRTCGCQCFPSIGSRQCTRGLRGSHTTLLSLLLLAGLLLGRSRMEVLHFVFVIFRIHQFVSSQRAHRPGGVVTTR